MFVAYLGCSSSFFGYIGYYYVDALLHWKSIEQKMRHAIQLSLITFICFMLGLLPE
jgi:H+/Cl- antiporter ClcA